MDIFIVDFISDKKLKTFNSRYLGGLLPRKGEEVYYGGGYYSVVSVLHDYDNNRVQVYVKSRKL